MIIIIIIYIKVIEAQIPIRISIIEVRVHIALHLMKQVQIIHQLMKYITSTALRTGQFLIFLKCT